MFHRSDYHCSFADVTVKGIKPDQRSPLVLVSSDADKLPDNDRLIIEDGDGFRYQRSIHTESLLGLTHMIFERI